MSNYLDLFINLLDKNIQKKNLKIIKQYLGGKKINYIDVGAHNGEMILLLSNHFKIKKNFAFEPNLEIVSKLKKLKIKNLNVSKYALSDRNGDDFLKILGNYSMALNLSRGKPIKYYSSDRIVQLMGNGLLTFIDKGTKLNEIITNDEAVFYKDIKDLIKKIYFYKKYPKKLKKIASNGKKSYLKKFNSNLVCQLIIQKTFNIKNKKKYFWN